MSALGLCAVGVGLAGCGLKGPLYLPTAPEAANRATLPSLLAPSRDSSSSNAPASPSPEAAVLPPAPASSSPASTGAPR